MNARPDPILFPENSRTFSAGLAILENVARGRDNNALNWVGLATSAFFDAGDRQQSAAAAASVQSSQVESYQAIASTSQQGASSQYFDRAGNVNWTNVAVQAVGTVVISNQLGSEAAINYFGNALGSAVSENAYAQVQRDETRNPSSASYRNEMDRESDSVTAARVEREAYSYRNGMDVESDGYVRPLTFAQDRAMRQAGNNPYGLSTASQLPGQVAMADDTRVLRDFDPDGTWDPNAPESMGKDRGQLGQNTAQLVLGNPATVGGAVGGGYRPVRPNGAGGPPGYDIRTDMPTTTPGFSWADPSVGLGAPPLQGESPSWKDFMTGGLPLPARALVNALDSLVFKSDSEKLSDNLKAAGYTRPADTDAHHIVPVNAGKQLDDVRTKLDGFGIGSNDAANGVFLPGVRGSEAEGAYHRSLHNKDYYDQLREDFRRVNSRQQALDTLGDVRSQLLNGAYPGSKPVPFKKP